MIKIIDGAVCYKAGMAVDGDGGYRTYAPVNSGLVTLDYLANAGHDGNWYGILTDDGQKTGKPIVQGPNDPYPGHYISPTSLRDHSKKTADPRSYLDAETVPYIAIPPEVHHDGVNFGDLCVVVYGDGVCGAIVGDGGPKNHYGEASIAVAKTLGIPDSPKNGGVASGVAYIIFTGTSKGWPRDVAELKAEAQKLFGAWKGSVDAI